MNNISKIASTVLKNMNTIINNAETRIDAITALHELIINTYKIAYNDGIDKAANNVDVDFNILSNEKFGDIEEGVDYEVFAIKSSMTKHKFKIIK